MKNLMPITKFSQTLIKVMVLGMMLLHQTVSSQENGYWDDRFGASNFGKDNYIHSIGVTDNGDIFVGGFLHLNGKGSGILKWNGSNWAPFGRMTSIVYPFMVIKNDLYIGGGFTKVDSLIPANRIAKYNLADGTWSSLGSGENNGVDHIVFALAAEGSDLYVGGAFRTAGGIPANHIVKYNTITKTWTPLGDGVDGSVQAIAVKNGEVYVGSSVGGVSANNIAKWNGREWSALGSGVNSQVYALTFCGDDLYVGGIFTQAGGSPANYVAKWNTVANTWSDVGGGASGAVLALASNGREVYVGGAFFYAGEIEASGIAKWSPAKSCWSRLGKGVNAPIYSMLVRGNDVYMGGQFGNAGGKPSNLFAIWHEPKSPSPHAPAWSSVPDVILAEGDSTKLELYQFVTDMEHSLQGLYFKAAVINFQETATSVKSSPVPTKNELDISKPNGLNDLQIQLKKMIMGPNGRYEYATFKSASNASGIYAVVFTVTDPCGEADSDTIQVIVTPANGSPLIAPLPELAFAEDKTMYHPIRYWYPFVSDADDSDSTLNLTVLSGKQVKATRYPVRYHFSAPANWFGQDTLQFIAADPSGLADTTSLVITVKPINDPVQLTGLPDSVSFQQGASAQLKIWDFADDVETPDSLLYYKFSASDPELRLSFNRLTGMLTLIAPEFHGRAHLVVTAGDGRSDVRDTIAIRVASPANRADLSTNVASREKSLPTAFQLWPNSPNPFNPSTTIHFDLPQAGRVKLAVYNLRGELVQTLVDGEISAGAHSVRFDGRGLASGVYFYRMEAGGVYMMTRKMVLQK